MEIKSYQRAQRIYREEIFAAFYILYLAQVSYDKVFNRSISTDSLHSFDHQSSLVFFSTNIVSRNIYIYIWKRYIRIRKTRLEFPWVSKKAILLLVPSEWTLIFLRRPGRGAYRYQLLSSIVEK